MDNATKQSAGLWMLKWSAAIATVWAHLSVPVQALVIFMVIDYLTGLAGAAARKELSSAIGLKGLLKKTVTLLLIIAIHVAQKDLGLGGGAAPILAAGYAANELISIVENSAKLGVPIPAAVLALLLSMKSLQPKAATPEQIQQLRDEGK